jgi:hypothetical protein
MLMAPRQFNNFKVGPFEMTTTVAPDETPEQAMQRAYAVCEGQARASYKAKLAAFEAAFAAANAVVGGRR